MADEKEKYQQERRKLLTKISLGLSGLTAAIVATPVVGFLVEPLLETPGEQWRAVGPVEQFQDGQTVEVSYEDASPVAWAGVTGKTGAWLRRQGDTFTAFAVNCTHLGCPVRWITEANLFMCPCHGGVYYADGKVAAGPPPRALTQYQVRVRDGQVEILTGPTPIA